MQIVNGISRSIRTTPSPTATSRHHDPAGTAAGRCHIRGRTPYIVTRERIRLFAELTHNDHPIHHREAVARDYGYPALAAPPTFAALAMARAQYDAVRILAPGVRHTALLHTRQTLDIRRLLVAGDIVSTDIRIRSVRSTVEYACVEAQLTLTDHDGDIVQSGSSSLYVCAAAVPAYPAAVAPAGIRETGGRTQSPAGRDRSWDTSAPGLPLPRRSFSLDSADMDSYAALGTPGHHRTAPDPGARSGPPSGLMRLGLSAGYLSSCLGDPAAVTHYDAEFTHFSGQTGRGEAPVEICGRVIAVDETGAGLIELDGRCLDRKLFIRAQAMLRPPAH